MHRRPPDLPASGRGHPFLLTMPAYSGTLAAARCLGERGVPVTMAGENGLAPARWSRYVTRWVISPPVEDTERFFEWLLEFGEREPGHVLYPTCDDLAWLVADRAVELGKSYRLYQPSVTTILGLLDKKSLHLNCLDLGMSVVPTAFPATFDEAVLAAQELGFPLLLKPRTQILLNSRSKGILVQRAEDLPRRYREFMSWNHYKSALRAPLTGGEAPMLQVFDPRASESIYSMAGFIGRDEGQIAVRASRKILQRPRKLGVGLCFEEAPVDPALLGRLVCLCKRLGYFGVFEAEFVQDGPTLKIIDFNPRFYGQMGFEIGRDLPLAYLVWLAALGESDELSKTLAEARCWLEGKGYGYCDRFYLDLVLLLQRMSGAMSTSDVERWYRWKRDHQREALMIDAADWPTDRLPRVVSAVREIVWASLHPRSFIRKTIRDGV